MKELQIYTQAARRYREAAEQGDADAQALLGLMYEVGLGVPHDYVQAYFWLTLAPRAALQFFRSPTQKCEPGRYQDAPSRSPRRSD